MNPIIEREVRARWRGLKAFGLLLAYAAPLALAVVIAYHGAAHFGVGSGNFTRESAATGQKVFRELAWMQVLAWMFFAPTLTATTIAGERERGLLESLQLSRMTGGQIVRGKLLSALLFVALMTLASLPVLSICFLLGGVSPAEFCQAIALALVTATTCATVGIACSAWSRRAGTALRVTFVCIAIWGIGSAIANRSSAAASFWDVTLGFIALTHPLSAAFSIFDSRFTGAVPPSVAPLLFGTPFWLANIALQVAAIALMLPLAARALRRPFGDQHWIEARKSTPEKRRTFQDGGMWSLPLASSLRFANPVLRRELRGKFRMRVVPKWVLLFECVLGLAVLWFYGWALRTAWTKPDSRELMWWMLVFIGLFIVMIASAMMGASGLSREREAGTWEGLTLSLLPSREILLGKIGAPLIACALFSLPIWPLLGLSSLSSRGVPFGGAISPLQAFLAFCIVAATAFCYTAVGLFFSSQCRRTAVSSGWTLATLLIVNLLLPMMGRGFDDGNPLQVIHPLMMLLSVIRLRSGASQVSETESTMLIVASIFSLLLIGSVLLYLTSNSLRSRARQRD